MKWWFFYIPQSQKDKNFFYKDSSDNLQCRLNQHHAGYVQSTKAYRPFKLVYFEGYRNEESARLREKRVKQSGSISTPLIRRIKQDMKDF
ncbi:TPA: endonuclease [Candidatus Uhrbacteria bacterium]|nr:MAG: hypothetical protein A2317_03130 [Candidatus Uhrbacteria bacterium RIFOXYB2_FULL_41_10]OGL96041.1 MAG: hypothetical protein A2258_00485 [Candidatus Uhrbacteria bacterium RIFOXYA2_FULL_41_8]HAL50123.1 endonuclease [Candidatus Uhrbacteria bacterium]HAN06613.1 endonuclease [Candidatus Uhrbacteria bacterium]HAP65878.1 endonuclease [Candidatus Uhrbacteria bacterium]